VGDDYCGDPAQEAQGLNSVFATDSSTLQVVRKYVECLTAVKKSKDTVNRNQ
jgi:mannan endo-1,4-beta-mannosidase